MCQLIKKYQNCEIIHKTIQFIKLQEDLELKKKSIKINCQIKQTFEVYSSFRKKDRYKQNWSRYFWIDPNEQIIRNCSYFVRGYY